jgi:hypothetical protein
MKHESPKKKEIFLLLALRQNERLSLLEKDRTDPADNLADQFSPSFLTQLPASEAKKIEQLYLAYQNRSAEEKQKWREQIETYISSDETNVDENIHWSHIEKAMQNETTAIREIVAAGLHSNYRKYFVQEPNAKENVSSVRSSFVEKTVRKTFAAQFVALHNLPSVSAFDRLSGAQVARLVRQAGIREVALACIRITAVESVAAFLRRFSAEDARAIAAQMSGLPEIGNERLSFAENLVQSAMEDEPKPSAMLDLLGIRLVGTLLCAGEKSRIIYTTQKLPLEFAPKLAEIIDTQCRQTPAELQNEIGAEVERLAEIVVNTIEKVE